MGKKFRHGCGCITIADKDDVIEFVNMCDLHKKNRKYVWIALQHPTKEKIAALKEMIEAKYLCLNCSFRTESYIKKVMHQIVHPFHLVGDKINE